MMHHLIHRVRGLFMNHWRRMVHVGTVGAVGFIVQTSIFEILGIHLAIVAASTATLIGAEGAVLTNFFLNDRFNFSDGAGKLEALWRRLLRFHMVVSGSIATQWIFVFTMEQFTNDVWLLRAAYVSGIGIGFLVNYVGYYLFVWRVHRGQPNEADPRVVPPSGL